MSSLGGLSQVGWTVVVYRHLLPRPTAANLFIDRDREVEELENFLGGVPNGVPIAAM